MKWVLICLIFSSQLYGATIGIIDTGFDLDHEFLRPKILKQETDEEMIDPELKNKFHGWDFHDNSHIETPVIQNQDLLSDILKYRKLRAKGHSQGLTPEEYEWYGQKKADKEFRSELKKFRKHIHGTVVASIALREGENINIFPIRGLHIDVPVVAVESDIEPTPDLNSSITGIKKFEKEIKLSRDRVNRKFSKICLYLSLKKISIVNASYGITYKNIATKFQEMYLEYVGTEIPAPLLDQYINDYFNAIYESAAKTIKRYPNMLFVFSAGNSGLDNDLFHHYPSRVKLDNTITVSATNGDFLASFSNYGKTKADIGAPGVGIKSIIPKV
ncbi:MAG TPA: S8 family serine peptidase, partial [Bacteriovoracaceae bacterium]|nr:S8 family serine peptidase [Bacteriovoracaceae bacterium]